MLEQVVCLCLWLRDYGLMYSAKHFTDEARELFVVARGDRGLLEASSWLVHESLVTRSYSENVTRLCRQQQQLVTIHR